MNGNKGVHLVSPKTRVLDMENAQAPLKSRFFPGPLSLTPNFLAALTQHCPTRGRNETFLNFGFL
jgi:hypothetical protein